MIVIPAIDLRDGHCVRLTQGRKSDVTVYNENPVAVAREFAAAGVQIIHVIDLDGAFGEPFSPNRAVVKKIIEKVDVAIEFGGGVRSLPDVKELCDAGVSRVVLGTIAAESPESLKDFVDLFSTRICVGIDARDGVVMTHGWETATPAMAVDLASRVAASGVKRIVYTDIARDGMMVGPNIEQTLAVARASNIQVTASGGVSSLDDLKQLRDAGEPLLDSVIVGKALYEGKFKLEEALRVMNRPQIL
ncbi:MAG TPA: 1-(5-phosphoribosyl)-5-[(5-phosphoribosylamino)methylideneamino]imidazole-4-carboxamide isomerase [Pyrinomonadaceae bacterium]|jgi:phosphoribosylformimino-5-aminoimidazole carboxamide ribotide isomerase|nr:1-(5-phosphoribosyl)-5-[(5-phosphoribosylamino)methylideneamino]imidazole-4-carboxamide isomerase [Pyrinomonadaceae bacterium]